MICSGTGKPYRELPPSDYTFNTKVENVLLTGAQRSGFANTKKIILDLCKKENIDEEKRRTIELQANLPAIIAYLVTQAADANKKPREAQPQAEDSSFPFTDGVNVLLRGNPFFKKIDCKLLPERFLLYPDDFSRLSLPDGEKWTECKDFLSQNQDAIREAQQTVASNLRQRKDGTRENTNIIGIQSSIHQRDVLCCELYPTNYFTHRVMEIVKDNPATSFDISEHFENPDKGYLRTSLGANVLLRIPHDNKILLVKRSQRAAYGNAGKIYLSVVETMDADLDFVAVNPRPNCVLSCICRGLEEELGIPDIFDPACSYRMYEESNIVVRSLFYTAKYRQDNIFAIVTLNSSISLEDVKRQIQHNAKDFILENSDLLEVYDTATDIGKFIDNNKENLITQTRYCLEDYLWLRQKGHI